MLTRREEVAERLAHESNLRPGDAGPTRPTAKPVMGPPRVAGEPSKPTLRHGRSLKPSWHSIVSSALGTSDGDGEGRVYRLAQWAVGITSVALLVLAGVGAVWLHQHSMNSGRTDQQSQVLLDGHRLHAITSVLFGSSLPVTEPTCAWFAHIDQVRTGHRYPARGSTDWNRVMTICTSSSGR